MTLEEFGKTIKQKYPQYSDISDKELGQKMLSKYPQYSDLVANDSPATSTFLEGHSIIKGINDILGTSGLAKGATQAIFLNFTKEGKDVQNMLQTGEITKEEFDKIVGGGLATPKEVIGSAIQTGTTLAPAGMTAPKGITAGKRVGEAALKVGGVSAVAGGAQALAEEKNTREIAKRAAISGGIGATLGGGVQAVQELATFLSSPTFTEGLYNKSIGIPKKIVEKGKSPSGMLLREGVFGTKETILKRSQNIADTAEKEIDSIVRNNPQRFATEDILRQIKSNISKQFGNSLDASEVQSIVDKLPLNQLRTNKYLSPRQLNSLRSTLDNKFLGSSRWLNDSTAERILGLKSSANVLRGVVQGTDDKLPNLFSRLSSSITAIRSLKSELAKPHALTTMLEILGSLIYGGASGGLNPEGIKNALIAFGVSKGLESGLPGTLTSVGLKKLGEKALIPTVSQAVQKTIPTATRLLTKDQKKLQ